MAKYISIFVLAAALCFGGEKPQTISQDYIAQVFKQNQVTGTFVLYDLKADSFTMVNPTRADSAAIPASTFKIFNSLVILEEGIMADENQTLKWDGQKKFLKIWEKDHNLKSAIKYSVVWFYQECARRVGEDRMQFWIDSVGFGNQKISGGIDRFWLDGGLRISAKQYIEFLKRLYFDQLPFSERSMDIVKRIMIRKQANDFTLRAKTGWADSFTPQIGWYVGYLEQAGNVFFFAMNMDIRNNADGKKRKKIALEVLGLK